MSQLSTLDSENLESQARSVLQRVFGFGQFRGQQQAIVSHVTAGGDALVLMPTGGGKSLCYQVPALLRPGCAVVVSPLIALMQNQVTALLQMGVRAAFLNSSLGASEAERVRQQFWQGELDLLYVAPERLMSEPFLALLTQMHSRGALALFAIDEAHCVSQWGHDFRKDYLGLSILAQRFGGVPRIALTATADSATRAEIISRLQLSQARLFSQSFDRPNIRYEIVTKSRVAQQLLTLIESEHAGECGIVYCLSRDQTESVAELLASKGHLALPYHAGLSASMRERHLRRFLQEESVIMVATIAFGMGIDKPSVRFVAHMGLPKSVEAYYQESGRAGRDGQAAHAWMAYGLADVVAMKAMIDQGEGSDERKRLDVTKLGALLGMCESVRCRRASLLAYFGEQAPEHCGNCDNCLHPPQTVDARIMAQKALSCVYRLNQRFGAGHVVDVLLGKQTEKVQQWRHDQIKTFGIGSELSERGWSSLLRQLIAAGFLSVDQERFGALTLTDKSRSLLTEGAPFEMRIDPAPLARKEKQRRSKSTPREETSGERLTQREHRAAKSEHITQGSSEERLFEALRLKRRELAESQNVAAFVIFHDSTLRAFAIEKPTTLNALRQISGVGEKKSERYGETILEVIRKAQSQSPSEAAP